MLTNNQKETIKNAIEEISLNMGLASITEVCKMLDHLAITDIHAYMIVLCKAGEYAMHRTDTTEEFQTEDNKKYWLKMDGSNYIGICKR